MGGASWRGGVCLQPRRSTPSLFLSPKLLELGRKRRSQNADYWSIDYGFFFMNEFCSVDQDKETVILENACVWAKLRCP